MHIVIGNLIRKISYLGNILDEKAKGLLETKTSFKSANRSI